jgi:predicted transposase YdaD
MEPLGQTVKAWQILYKGELMIDKVYFIWLAFENDMLIHHKILYDIIMYVYTNSYYSIYLKTIVIDSKRANQLNQEVNTFTLAEVEIWNLFRISTYRHIITQI